MLWDGQQNQFKRWRCSLVDISHLQLPRLDGWGFLPPTEQVFNIFREVKETVPAYNILEIGFNAGHSTTYLLEIFDEATVHSIGPSPKMMADLVLREKYDKRFWFHRGTTEEVRNYLYMDSFDFAFVDGHHGKEYVKLDLHYCVTDLCIPYILVDNTERSYIKKIADMFSLQEVKTWEYNNDWKGEQTVNNLTLYQLKTLMI